MTSNDCSEVDYTSFEEVFPAFWEANLKGDYSCIDFNKAFTELRQIWFDFEVGHRGGLGFEKWFEYLEADHMNTDPKLGGSVLFAEKVGLTDEEAWDLLQTDRKKLMELYHPIFEEEYNDQKDDPLMKELVKTRLMMMRPPEDLSSNILLMDRVVNAVHLGGWTIYPGYDIDSAKKEVEKEFYSKTKEPEKPCPEISYYDIEEVFPAFWEANIKRDYSCFDFDEAFNQLSIPMYDKLAEHGLLGRDTCIEHITEMWWPMDIIGEKLDIFTIDNPYVQISTEDIREVIMNLYCERYEETFGDDPVFTGLLKTYDKMKSPPQEEKEKAILMDEVIDAVHHTGSMWDDQADVESLKTEFEEKYSGGNPMKEVCVTRVKEVETIIEKRKKGDKSACIPREGLRGFVGCLAVFNRENKGMDMKESMKKAWETVNEHKCPPKAG